MIDTEALRKKVIELAIQGKLTEQLPSDGDAKDLFRRIQEDKARLLKEGKIRKEKTTSPLTEDVPYKIPSNWKWVRLGDVCNEMLVPQRDKPKSFGGDIPWCRIEDIEGKYLNGTKSSQYVTQSTVDSMNLRINPVGSVISACSASIGAAAICTVRCITNQTFIGLVCSDGLYNEYLFYFLQASTSILKKLGTGMTISYISQDKYRDMLLPLPPLLEQTRIVEKLDTVLEQINTIDSLQKKYESNLSVLRNKIIDAGIRGKLTKQLPEDGDAETLYAQIQEEKAKLIKEGKIKKEKPLPEIEADEIPFEIPKNWKWVRWGELSEKIQYGYNAPAKQTGRIKMVRISDIQDGKVQWDTVPYCNIEEKDISDYLLRKGDILFARTGGTVGKSYIVSEVPEDSIFAGYLIRTSYSPNICASFMKRFMESNLYWKQLQSGTIATAQPNCNGKTLSKMMVPFPPLEEQRRIAKTIDKMLQIIG